MGKIMNSSKAVKSGDPAPHVAPVTIYAQQLETNHVSQLVMCKRLQCLTMHQLNRVKIWLLINLLHI